MRKKLKSIQGFQHAGIRHTCETSESLEQIASAPNLHFISVTIQKSGYLAFKICVRVPDSFGGAHESSVIRLIQRSFYQCVQGG
ncbi:hypothetical protein PS659_04497 [Pseudomonas fluorescens]|uniref:Uncharacterized protein n=1 Tax=Pseudomonas fluorescens TaxID=294 RepID=A0A5E6W3V4_PSEFL|nr:hypothetical protein PS659_04497 [Pseudomonas fluorescens]